MPPSSKDPAARYPTGTAVMEALDAGRRPRSLSRPARWPAAMHLPSRSPPSVGVRSYAPVLVQARARSSSGSWPLLLFNALLDAGPSVPAASEAPSATVAPRPSPPLTSTVGPRRTRRQRPHRSPLLRRVARSHRPRRGHRLRRGGTAPEDGSSPAPPPRATRPTSARLLLRASAPSADWNGGEAAFLELVAHDRRPLPQPRTMAAAARDLAVALDREGNGDPRVRGAHQAASARPASTSSTLISSPPRAAPGAALRAATVLRRRAGALAPRHARAAHRLPAPRGDLRREAEPPRSGRQRGRTGAPWWCLHRLQGSACFKKHNRALLEAMTQRCCSRLNRGSVRLDARHRGNRHRDPGGVPFGLVDRAGEAAAGEHAGVDRAGAGGAAHRRAHGLLRASSATAG